jgi:hypothetical protein
VIPVVEDYLSELLTEKLSSIKKNPDMIYSILGMSKQKQDSLKQFLSKNDINIRRGYPITPAELPCICILLSSEEEEQEGLGDLSGEDNLVTAKQVVTEVVTVVDTMGGRIPGPYVEVKGVPLEDVKSVFNITMGISIPPEEFHISNQNLGVISFTSGMIEHGDELEIIYTNFAYAEEESQFLYESTYKIEVWATNADLTVELYHLAKWALLSGRKTLGSESHLFRQKLSGSDFQPAPGYFPVFVYRRGLTFWCQFTASVIGETEELRFVNKVETNQILYSEGDEHV